MDKIFKRQFAKAMLDGRKCSRCGRMITVLNWKKGERQCVSCIDALKGVNVNSPFGKWRDEPVDRTGDAL